jgi:DNA-binding NtrC family response regulator
MESQVILCVDDEPGILRSLGRCLSSEGYEVLQAACAEEALKVLESRFGKVDLIIADQRMPRMQGDEFLRLVNERYGKRRAIMLSGYADVDGLSRVISDGRIAKFIAKPWSNDDLLQAVRSVLKYALNQ